MHCPLLQTFWLHPFVFSLIQSTTDDIRENSSVYMKQSVRLFETRPTNFTSLVFGSVQATGPKERRQDKLNRFCKLVLCCEVRIKKIMGYNTVVHEFYGKNRLSKNFR